MSYKNYRNGAHKMGLLNGSGLMNTALYGLQNTYSILAQNSTDGKISLKDITNPSTEVLQQLGYNSSFAQYLSSNFSALDKDGDGTISADDVSNLTSKLQQNGLSYQEIVQLCSSGAMGNSSLTSTVLNYFDQIDTDGNGRVTDAEIRAFSLKADEEKMKTKYQSFKASDMTVFYGDENASDEEPSSLIDNLYPKDSDS